MSDMFKISAQVAKLGELFTENQAEANNWKKRMLAAGITGLSIPEDWDSLSEDEKQRRLDAVIKLAQMEDTKS